MEIEPMFDEDGFRREVAIETDFISEALSERITEIARRYYREAVGKYSSALLEHATTEFKAQLASILVAGIRSQQRQTPDQTDESVQW